MKSKCPGIHVQVDVKFLTLQGPQGQRMRRYQYTAIDDAMLVRAFKIYRRHTQQNAIAFVDHVIQQIPFRIHTVRTDRGHEFQALFRWHVADQRIRHVSRKPRTPQLNGEVECSHRTKKQECYQLLTYRADAALEQTLAPLPFPRSLTPTRMTKLTWRHDARRSRFRRVGRHAARPP